MSRRALAAALALSATACSRAAAPEAAPPVAPAIRMDTAAAFPTRPPQLGPAPTLTLPAPVQRTLANGLEVLYVRHGSLPVVHATLLTPGGTSADPAALPGLAEFTAEMLDEGAGGRNALQLSAALELLGATLTTDAAVDGARVDLHVLRDRLPEALRLLADVVVRPDFPQRELRRQKQQRLTELNRARDEARTIAGNAFQSIVYGSAHPYGRLPGLRATNRLDQAAVRRFHRTYYRPAGSALILVGAVEPEVLHPLVERAFSDWQGRAPEPGALPGAPEAPRLRLVLVDKPGAAQSEIRVGHVGVPRDHPDYFALVVMNTLLGDSFTSRLNTNLRETHGFAYGARSQFSMWRGAGPFVASSAVFTAKTDSAVVEFLRELRRVRDQPVPGDELERAKRYVALGFPRRFEETRDVAAEISTLETYDLPVDFLNTYVDRVMAVTAADVQRVAREHIRPDRAVIVVVGDRSKIEPGLRALELGPIETRETGEFVR